MMTIREINERLRRKELSPVELTRQTLHRINGVESTLNAFITVTERWR